MPKQDNEISRRDWLKAAAIFGGAAAVGSALSTDDSAQMVPGGGGGGSVAKRRLHIERDEVVSISALTWYSNIHWDTSGVLELEDGDSLGLVNGNE